MNIKKRSKEQEKNSESSQNDQLPLEHYTGIAEVVGSNPVQAWLFFQANFAAACVVHITSYLSPLL